jgi:acyl-ACP thioesterase
MLCPVTPVIVPPPPSGRVFRTERVVRVADADERGRLRLDALARFVQDIGSDDVADAGLDPTTPWVIRRSAVEIEGWAQLGDRLAVRTWCGGIGSRWAERRVSFEGSAGRMEVATLVVHLDGAGRPARVPAIFHEIYGEATQGRTLTSRLSLPPPGDDATTRPWPLRSSDLDVMGHVNNAVPWAAVEDELHRQGAIATAAVVEWLGPIEIGDEVELRTHDDLLWLVVGGQARVAAQSSASSR